MPTLVELSLPDDKQLRARVWVAQVGRIPLLLLDSDIPENEHDLRNVTDRLYGGDQEHRIKQELLAGIGGVRAIRAFTAIEGRPDPDVFHMNEGHAGFLGIERIREFMTADNLDFDTALTVVRASTVFTTHTPVPAGIDRFPVEMVRRYFDDDSKTGLLQGVPVQRVLAFGAEDPEAWDDEIVIDGMRERLAQLAHTLSTLKDELLHTGDPCPNRRGLTELGFEPVEPAALLAVTLVVTLGYTLFAGFRGVVANVWTLTLPFSSTEVGAPLEITCQCAGAATVMS